MICSNCSNCGAELVEGKRFCHKCGQAVGLTTPIESTVLSANPAESQYSHADTNSLEMRAGIGSNVRSFIIVFLLGIGLLAGALIAVVVHNEHVMRASAGTGSTMKSEVLALKPAEVQPQANNTDTSISSDHYVTPNPHDLTQFPLPVGYVNDFGHLLSPEAVARVDGICSQIDHSHTDAQVFVVTIETLDGADIAEFATSLSNKWGIGHKDSNRGVLILLDVDEHKWRITVGYGLESVLTDAKAAEIGREATPLLRANNFEGSLTLFVSEVARVIDDDDKVNLDSASEKQH
jgi:hypothetical protein